MLNPTPETYRINDEVTWRAIDFVDDFYEEEYDMAENIDLLLDALHNVVEPLANDDPIVITIDDDVDRGCTFLSITAPAINNDTVFDTTMEAINELENQLVFEMPSAVIDELRTRAHDDVVVHRPTSG